MIFYLSIFTLFLTLSLTFHNYSTNKNSFFLAGYLIPLCLYCMLHYLLFKNGSVIGIAILFKHVSPLFYLPGLMLFFYIRGSLINRWQFTKHDLWHLLPFCVGLLNVSPYYFVSFSEKIRLAEKITLTSNFDQFNSYIFYPYYISAIIRSTLFLGYTVTSAYLLYKNWKTTYSKIQEISKKNLFKWLAFLNTSAFILAICFIFLTFVFYTDVSVRKSDINNYFFTYFAGTLFCLTPIVMIFYPQVVYGVPISIITEKKTRNITKKKLNEQKNTMDLLAEKILAHFETDKPYLDKDFSLNDLATNLKIPKYQIYTCLNVSIKKKFTQLRTNFRIEHAKKLLLSEETDLVSLQGIWMESGFSSKTNFFTTFKEETGLTPTEFIQKEKRT